MCIQGQSVPCARAAGEPPPFMQEGPVAAVPLSVGKRRDQEQCITGTPETLDDVTALLVGWEWIEEESSLGSYDDEDGYREEFRSGSVARQGGTAATADLQADQDRPLLDQESAADHTV
ncbi:unnamed protein product [Vitrella brassicaformis CCMP3155]|uniref:Uncharacterized protein n=1 Tax=Vitrella brassicaformis (strain CCMP3155) TaxID=1169540 RepID=A0A0G4G894_VITBC|nr:unnamed protein product [Vitrella brassicaformis CCMP3155]|eukprot:CEM25106.1 unnamed protein product [Vitrella brassicaformis CCMP3155]